MWENNWAKIPGEQFGNNYLIENEKYRLIQQFYC